jgi:hypothetical protein
MAPSSRTGGTGGTGPTGGTGGVNANPDLNPTGGSGGSGSTGGTGGTGSYSHTTGGSGGSGSTGGTGPIGYTGHTGGTGSDKPTRNIIYGQYDTYIRRIKLKFYAPYLRKGIIKVFNYDDNNNPYPNYTWTVSPGTFSTYFRQKGLPAEIRARIEARNNEEFLLDYDIPTYYYLDVFDYQANKTSNYYMAPGVYSYDYRILISPDSTSLSIAIPGLKSYYVNKQYVTDNINNPLSSNNTDQYKLYYPEWKFNQPYLKAFFKQLDDDTYYDLLSGKALPWCNEYSEYNYVYPEYYTFKWAGQDNTVRFDITIGSELYSLGALHVDLTLLIDKESSPNY